MPTRLAPAIPAALLIVLVFHLFCGAAQPGFAQGAPVHLGDNTEYVGPYLWTTLQRHADGEAVPDIVVVEIGYRTDLEVDPPLEEFIRSTGGERVAEFTWRIPSGKALSVIQRPDLLYMAQPPEANEGETDPYPNMDGTLDDIVVAYTGGIPAEHAVRYAMFIWDGSVVLEMESSDAATVESIRKWLTQQGVYVPPASDFAAFSDEFLAALVPVSRLTPLAEAFPATYLSVSTHAGQGLSLDRAHWPADSLELENAVVAQFLPQLQDPVTPATALPPKVTDAGVSPTPISRYDRDGDGLIEVTNLEQMDVIRYDLDGDGKADNGSEAETFTAAYPVSREEVVCNSCRGYELARPLDFADADSYASGEVNAEWTTGEGWRPIGDGWHPFSAMFSGNYHTIANLHITSAVRPDSASAHGFGLFGTVGKRGVIRQAGLLNASITGGDFVGPLAGSNRGTITQSYAKGSASGYGCIGGLVGSNDLGLINFSYATVSVSRGFTYLGGLAGCNNQGSIIASYATGPVSGDTKVGGLVGENDGWVTTSYATGSVRGQKYVGGLVGKHRDGQISASYSTGEVTGGHYVGGLVGGNEGIIIYTFAVGRVSSNGSIDSPLQYVGGLVGYNPGIITSSYWDTETSGQSVGIGIEIGDGWSSNVHGNTTAELQSPEGYSGPYQEWDVSLGIEGRENTPHYNLSDFWDFGISGEYPALKVDFDGDGTATWREFGNQRGHAPVAAPAAVGDICVVFMAAPVIEGAWSSDCVSGSRPGSYARFYTFTMTESSGVIIDLESGDSDTYLYLLQGGGRAGEALASQGSSSRSSRIEHMLDAGTYTVEATTYDGAQSGSFTLTVERFTAPPPAHVPVPPSTATLPPSPIPTMVVASTPVLPEPPKTPVLTETATLAREPAPASKSVAACNYPQGNTPGDTADFGLLLLAAPLTVLGWLKLSSRRKWVR